MTPRYMNGDLLGCKKLSNSTFFQWGKAYVLDTEQGALTKIVEQAENPDNILLVSENPKYKPFELAKKEIYSISLIVGVIRLE